MITGARIHHAFNKVSTTKNALRYMTKSFVKEPIEPVAGVRASIIRQFDKDDVSNFSKLMEDKNPIHLSGNFAERTGVIERPVVHASLISGVVETLVGSKLPGPGSVIIMQSVRYPAPLYVGDTMRAEVVVSSVKEKFVDLSVECTNMSIEDNKTIFSI